MTIHIVTNKSLLLKYWNICQTMNLLWFRDRYTNSRSTFKWEQIVPTQKKKTAFQKSERIDENKQEYRFGTINTSAAGKQGHLLKLDISGNIVSKFGSCKKHSDFKFPILTLLFCFGNTPSPLAYVYLLLTVYFRSYNTKSSRKRTYIILTPLNPTFI